MQANTKLKQCTMLETKFPKIQWAHTWEVFSQCCFLLKASLNFSPEKKNVKDSSGAFVGQGNGY